MRRFVVLLAACGGGSGDDAPPADAKPCVDTTHDEDLDGIGDACDICPASPDPRQLDTTERATMLAFPDGVGDACDPRANLSGDKEAAFHPFIDASEADRWDGSGWVVGDDRAAAAGVASFVAKRGATGDGLFVQARLGIAPIELFVDGNGVETGLVCGLVKASDGLYEVVAREIGGAMMSKSVGKEIMGAVALSTWRIIDVTGQSTLRCRAMFDGGMTVLDLPATDAIAIGSYGFSTQTAATVESIVVYTSPTLPQD